MQAITNDNFIFFTIKPPFCLWLFLISFVSYNNIIKFSSLFDKTVTVSFNLVTKNNSLVKKSSEIFLKNIQKSQKGFILFGFLLI
ncbi:hypothetical protein BCR23_05070 [Enterococcus quebecensis]|uniref:Uncharacterized protein n=1 Tax=Enterococcus quebecensis TaxID=903983 RepID=A0A1E5GUA9_9ENTE|nr:hypothetical protein BCR23_05070 [Enterococcus quebecensis]